MSQYIDSDLSQNSFDEHRNGVYYTWLITQNIASLDVEFMMEYDDGWIYNGTFDLNFERDTIWNFSGYRRYYRERRAPAIVIHEAGYVLQRLFRKQPTVCVHTLTKAAR